MKVAARRGGLERFLVEERVGQQAQFWNLAQSFSAWHPSASDEGRSGDGVLAREKDPGF